MFVFAGFYILVNVVLLLGAETRLDNIYVCILVVNYFWLFCIGYQYTLYIELSNA